MSDVGDYIPLVKSEIDYIDFFSVLRTRWCVFISLSPPQKERAQRQNTAFTGGG